MARDFHVIRLHDGRICDEGVLQAITLAPTSLSSWDVQSITSITTFEPTPFVLVCTVALAQILRFSPNGALRVCLDLA